MNCLFVYRRIMNMEKSKKCCICDYEFSYNDSASINPFITPMSNGAKYYFDLWHFDIDYFLYHC